jgi:hypothetical protein
VLEILERLYQSGIVFLFYVAAGRVPEVHKFQEFTGSEIRKALV